MVVVPVDRPAQIHATHGYGNRYRPEIDGLRAVAVLVVLVNHLNPAMLPGGYLGVDLFFVISGAVVTGSLVSRPAPSPRRLLIGFYARRFRRLLPALMVTLLVVALLFSALVNPAEASYQASLRTGLSALFGVANLYLLRQGSDYFATDNHYNPFLHTWSLGVEEQFYLVWPIVLLVCGLGRASVPLVRRRLGWLSGILSLASLASLAVLQFRGQNDASFFLMSARFWELAAGAAAWLVLSQRPDPRPTPAAPAWWSLALVLMLLLTPESWRITATLLCVASSCGLVLWLNSESGPGRWLAKPLPLAIGLSSYSLYLWHWPVIVLAHWSVGLNRWTLLPILMVIALLTGLSYRLECRFRPAGAKIQPDSVRPLLLYPALALLSAGGLALLSGPARGVLFLGDRRHLAMDTPNSPRIPGIHLDTTICFREPMAPLADRSTDDQCTLKRHPGQPTLYFEGDSHTQALIPLAGALMNKGAFNVAFFSRGGCLIPAAGVKPQSTKSDDRDRFRLCQEHSRLRLQYRLQDIRPGDQLVLATKLPAYLLGPDPNLQAQSQARYAAAIKKLAADLKSRGAGLIITGPLPLFIHRPVIAVPMSLCQREWYRVMRQLPPGCAPTDVARSELIAHLDPVEQLLSDLEAEIPNLHVFRPFAILCPPDHRHCSTFRGDRMLFVDSNHLSREGVNMLEEPFLNFLKLHGLGRTAQRSSSRATPIGSVPVGP